ncbi:sodium- and chloride-dependent betaine transporter-like [Takifugu rubripes]|uniref:sodium- and chloride-dependent betaine transporter-like n=1 Tax=Takifugu rubripes TaxID=31033 RepID=UPI001145C1DE|nr:sodium- and chloride-dependent betaine transporter-like [Takifugu rubripes]
MEHGERDQWSKKREYILASAGNIVGLGNVWRFPYLCFKNGGGVFLLPYCFFTVLCGLPLFLLETVMGQFTQEGVVTCWTKICPLAQGTGYFIIIIQIYFRVYTIVLAWIVFYLINSFRGTLPWATCNNPWNTDRCMDLSTAEGGHLIINSTNLTKSSVSEFWERRVLSISSGIEELGTVRWELLLCLLACWIACYFCIWKGVRSTGKVVYFTAIFPYVMLAILLVRGLTLPGALQGLVFYLYPDVSRLADLQVWMDACSQVLFSYGVSAGTLITFGSYNKLKNNCCRDCLWLSVLNASTSFVAGFVVFSTLGFMAQAQGVPIDMVAESGPGLAFIAFPQAIAMMPLPQLWAVCFFFMLLLLGIDTMFAGLEALISAMIDLFPGEMRRPWRREAGLLIFCCTCFIVQICLTTEGGVYLFELVDYYGCSGTCILFGSLIQCLAVGWAFGAEQMCNAVEEITGQRPWLLYKLCWRYFTPLLSLVGLICSFLNYQPLRSRGGYVYPDWSYHLGLAMALSSMVVIPFYAVAKLCFTKGTLKQRLLVLWYPDRGAAHPKRNGHESETIHSSDI